MYSKGGVYMRKLAPALVSYWDDFFIPYRVYITSHLHLVIWRYTSCWENTRVIQNHTHYAWATHSSLPADRFHTKKGGRFCVYMIPLQDFVPEWNSRSGTRTGVNSCRGDSRWRDILWWYHVNKYRAMRGNRSELAPGRKSPRCHVNTP